MCTVRFASHSDRKQCILVGHDWGAIIGWAFVDEHSQMVQRYIMMGAPPASVWLQSMIESPDQFSKSWYIFFFLMRGLPEESLKRNDYEALERINDGQFTSYFTEDDLEAYKYMFGRRGEPIERSMLFCCCLLS